MTMKPTPIAARTISAGAMFGSTWRHRILRTGVPQAMAASRNASCRSASTSERVRRAIPGHHASESARMTLPSPAPRIAVIEDGEDQLGERQHDVGRAHQHRVEPTALK